jgi:hypothetical protein
VVDTDYSHIWYLDPWTGGVAKMTHENFEVARKGYGTDEDLIFV